MEWLSVWLLMFLLLLLCVDVFCSASVLKQTESEMKLVSFLWQTEYGMQVMMSVLKKIENGVKSMVSVLKKTENGMKLVFLM